MPYVPSKKSVPPADDRAIIDPAVELLAGKIASRVVQNSDLKREYKAAFVDVAMLVDRYLKNISKDCEIQLPEAILLAEAICKAAKQYGYEGAHLGEFNYAITRLIQRVPQIKVARGWWEEKNELRYWIYIETAGALRYAEDRANELEYSTGEVFGDIKDEYKWRVNRAYEAAQTIKNGDCYDAPFYTRLVELVDSKGKHICYVDGYFERGKETLTCDIVPYQIVVRKKPDFLSS